jgi:hypothetical protein
MNLQVIPLQAVASQNMTVSLGGQQCIINVWQKSWGLFLDLYANGQAVVNSRLCLDRNPLVRFSYLPFVGDIYFADTQGTTDPTYEGLGTRYALLYCPDL